MAVQVAELVLLAAFGSVTELCVMLAVVLTGPRLSRPAATVNLAVALAPEASEAMSQFTTLAPPGFEQVDEPVKRSPLPIVDATRIPVAAPGPVFVTLTEYSIVDVRMPRGDAVSLTPRSAASVPPVMFRTGPSKVSKL